MVENRVIAPQKQEGDEELYRGLRPQSLDDFVGQRALCENLRVFVNAARDRKEAMDHVLLFGPPGLGPAIATRRTTFPSSPMWVCSPPSTPWPWIWPAPKPC